MTILLHGTVAQELCIVLERVVPSIGLHVMVRLPRCRVEDGN